MNNSSIPKGVKCGSLRQLLHHGGPVEQAPVFRDQSLRVKATDVDIADFEMLACSGHPKEVTLMCSLHQADCHYQVTFGNHKINGEFLVWEGGAKHAKEQFEAFAVPCHFGRQVGIVVRAIRRDVSIGTV